MECEMIKSVSVKVSHSEFYKLALKYGAMSEMHTCTLKIGRSDIESARMKSKSNGMEATLTIALSRSDFSTISSKQKIETTHQKLLSVHYVLRKRKLALEKIVPPAKKARTEIVRRIPSPKLVVASSDELLEGLVVIAKMKSYAAWPARIKSFRKTCVTVQFFGDETSGNVPYNNIGLIEANHQLIKWNLKKK